MNPLPTYAFLPANQPVPPVALTDGGRAWLVTRYDDVRKGLSDPRTSNDQTQHPVSTPFDALPAAVRPAIVGDVQNLDPPDNKRIRRMLAPAFWAQAAERLRPRLIALAGELINSLRRTAAGRPRRRVRGAVRGPVPRGDLRNPGRPARTLPVTCQCGGHRDSWRYPGCTRRPRT